MMGGKAMTRDEALLILNIEEEKQAELSDAEETLDPALIMERFDTLIEKNQVAKGGSFYLQSKIYWAK